MPLLLLAGVVTALAEFSRPTELLESAYGGVLLLKLLLVVVALILALAARRRALPAGPGPKLELLRRLTGTETATLLAVVGASAVLVNTAPPRPAIDGAEILGPAPLTGPVIRLASLAGQLAVYLAAADGELQVRVWRPAGSPPGPPVCASVGAPPAARPSTCTRAPAARAASRRASRGRGERRTSR